MDPKQLIVTASPAGPRNSVSAAESAAAVAAHVPTLLTGCSLTSVCSMVSSVWQPIAPVNDTGHAARTAVRAAACAVQLVVAELGAVMTPNPNPGTSMASYCEVKTVVVAEVVNVDVPEEVGVVVVVVVGVVVTVVVVIVVVGVVVSVVEVVSDVVTVDVPVVEVVGEVVPVVVAVLVVV